MSEVNRRSSNHNNVEGGQVKNGNQPEPKEERASQEATRVTALRQSSEAPDLEQQQQPSRAESQDPPSSHVPTKPAKFGPLGVGPDGPGSTSPRPFILRPELPATTTAHDSINNSPAQDAFTPPASRGSRGSGSPLPPRPSSNTSFEGTRQKTRQEFLDMPPQEPPQHQQRPAGDTRSSNQTNNNDDDDDDDAIDPKHPLMSLCGCNLCREMIMADNQWKDLSGDLEQTLMDFMESKRTYRGTHEYVDPRLEALFMGTTKYLNWYIIWAFVVVSLFLAAALPNRLKWSVPFFSVRVAELVVVSVLVLYLVKVKLGLSKQEKHLVELDNTLSKRRDKNAVERVNSGSAQNNFQQEMRDPRDRANAIDSETFARLSPTVMYRIEVICALIWLIYSEGNLTSYLTRFNTLCTEQNPRGREDADVHRCLSAIETVHYTWMAIVGSLGLIRQRYMLPLLLWFGIGHYFLRPLSPWGTDTELTMALLLDIPMCLVFVSYFRWREWQSRKWFEEWLMIQDANNMIFESHDAVSRVLRGALTTPLLKKLQSGDLPIEICEKATVGVVCVSNFTAWAQLSTPIQAIRRIQRLFNAFDEVLANTGEACVKVKTCGDRYIVLSDANSPDGRSSAGEHSSRGVITTAIALMKAAKMESLKSTDRKMRFLVSACVHTGRCFTALAGESKLTYELFGQALTVTHQVLKYAKPGSLVMTNNAKMCCDDSMVIQSQPLGPVRICNVVVPGRAAVFYKNDTPEEEGVSCVGREDSNACHMPVFEVRGACKASKQQQKQQPQQQQRPTLPQTAVVRASTAGGGGLSTEDDVFAGSVIWDDDTRELVAEAGKQSRHHSRSAVGDTAQTASHYRRFLVQKVVKAQPELFQRFSVEFLREEETYNPPFAAPVEVLGTRPRDDGGGGAMMLMNLAHEFFGFDEASDFAENLRFSSGSVSFLTELRGRGPTFVHPQLEEEFQLYLYRNAHHLLRVALLPGITVFSLLLLVLPLLLGAYTGAGFGCAASGFALSLAWYMWSILSRPSHYLNLTLAYILPVFILTGSIWYKTNITNVSILYIHAVILFLMCPGLSTFRFGIVFLYGFGFMTLFPVTLANILGVVAPDRPFARNFPPVVVILLFINVLVAMCIQWQQVVSSRKAFIDRSINKAMLLAVENEAALQRGILNLLMPESMVTCMLDNAIVGGSSISSAEQQRLEFLGDVVVGIFNLGSWALDLSQKMGLPRTAFKELEVMLSRIDRLMEGNDDGPELWTQLGYENAVSSRSLENRAELYCSKPQEAEREESEKSTLGALPGLLQQEEQAVSPRTSGAEGGPRYRWLERIYIVGDILLVAGPLKRLAGAVDALGEGALAKSNAPWRSTQETLAAPAGHTRDSTTPSTTVTTTASNGHEKREEDIRNAGCCVLQVAAMIQETLTDYSGVLHIGSAFAGLLGNLRPSFDLMGVATRQAEGILRAAPQTAMVASEFFVRQIQGLGLTLKFRNPIEPDAVRTFSEDPVVSTPGNSGTSEDVAGASTSGIPSISTTTTTAVNSGAGESPATELPSSSKGEFSGAPEASESRRTYGGLEVSRETVGWSVQGVGQVRIHHLHKRNATAAK